MSENNQVVICFVVYEAEKIVTQGSFQVAEEASESVFCATDGVELKFTHLYRGSTCKTIVSSLRGGKTVDSFELDIPINRTKKKWKQCKLGVNHELFYRSQLETSV